MRNIAGVSPSKNSNSHLEWLRNEIDKHSLVTRAQRNVLTPGGEIARWSFDFRPLLTNAETLDAICELFWKRVAAGGKFQVGGLETASILLVAGMILKAKSHGRSMSGFYVRKSRSKDGFQKQMEGNISDARIVLLDDILNTGSSFMRQIRLLEAEGRKIDTVCSIVRFRDEAFYTYFKEHGIKIISLFTLDDFPRTGGMKSFGSAKPDVIRYPFKIEWKFQSQDPVYFHSGPKSAPVIDDARIYFGTDNGSLWALNQNDGSVVWERKTSFNLRARRCFSSPALLGESVFFGAHDGNLYALDAATGHVRWSYQGADRICSSPCVAEDLHTIYVGLAFELWKKKGGIIALDAHTGEKKWQHTFSSEIHSSPAYDSEHKSVVIGSDEGVHCFDATSGTSKWLCKTKGPVNGSFAIDADQEIVSFGSFDTHIYIVDIRDGSIVHTIETFGPISSTPCIKNGRLYIGLQDKRVLCADITNGNILWTFSSQSRIFSTPEFIEGMLYIGSNDGRLYGLDPVKGTHLESFQATERIVNKIAFNSSTKRIFLPSFANEIHCLAHYN